MASKKKNEAKVESKPEEYAVVTEVKPLAQGRIMCEKPEKLSLVEQIQAHCILKGIAEATTLRLNELRETLMSVAKAKGEVTGEEGTRKYLVEGNSVCVEFRGGGECVNEEKMRTLLKAKNIEVTEVFDEHTIKAVVFNPSKLDYLVQIGKISTEELKTIKDEVKPTEALKVLPSAALKKAIIGLGLKKKAKLDESEAQEAAAANPGC